MSMDNRDRGKEGVSSEEAMLQRISLSCVSFMDEKLNAQFRAWTAKIVKLQNFYKNNCLIFWSNVRLKVIQKIIFNFIQVGTTLNEEKLKTS